MRTATFETGLSDHHKLATNILRKTISKGNSNKLFYRDYKRFDQKKFETELKLKLNSQRNLRYSTFQAVFLISTKKGVMKTGTIIRSKGIFVLNYSARPKKNILMILMSKVFRTTKNSGKP